MVVNLPAILAPAFFRRMATGFSRNVSRGMDIDRN